MRIQATHKWACLFVLGLATLLGAPSRSRAQCEVSPVGARGWRRPCPSERCGWFWTRRDDIPRTYSYQYDTWLNQPCKIKVVGPCGKTYWKTTVRGLDLGTPWPGP